MRNTGRPGRLRFKPKGQTGYSGQLVPKSKKRTAPQKSGSRNTPPPNVSPPVGKSDNPVSPDPANKKLRFEDETASDTASPPKSADSTTSGQVGPKSGKLRQDSKKPRPSERLRRDGDPPPGNEKTDTTPGGETAGADSHSGSASKRRRSTESVWRNQSSVWKRAAIS